MPDPAVPEALQVSPRPRIDDARAATLAREVFGVEGRVSELGSHQDRNFRVVTDDGVRVLKIANRGWGRAAIEAQNAALRHLASRQVPFAAPVPLTSLAGADVAEAVDGEDRLPLRLLTYVEGTPLSGTHHLSPAVVADLGRLAGHASAALSDFDHPGLDRVVQWDLRQADTVLAGLLGSVADPARQALVADRAAAASERLARAADGLRIQAIHGDVTDDNVVGHADDAGRIRPDGVIDFGDLTRSWMVGDIAVTAASVLRHGTDDPFAVLPAIRAFHELVPLDDADVAALWPLIVLRGAVLVASGEHQAILDPDNELATEPLESELRIFHVARSVDFDVAEATIRAALGMPAASRHEPARAALAAGARLLPEVDDLAVVDLSVLSTELHSGRFLQPGIERDLLA